MRRPDFYLCENKGTDQLYSYAKTKAQISCAVTALLICTFVFTTRIVQFLFYLYPKFQDSSFFLWVYRPVCVGPGQKSRKPVFSRRGSYDQIAKSVVIERDHQLTVQMIQVHMKALSIEIVNTGHKKSNTCYKIALHAMGVITCGLDFCPYTLRISCFWRKSSLTSNRRINSYLHLDQCKCSPKHNLI